MDTPRSGWPSETRAVSSEFVPGMRECRQHGVPGYVSQPSSIKSMPIIGGGIAGPAAAKDH